jgi:hypothetical protein
VTKAELESKHLAELHALAADAGVERYRMLPRAELIEKLADGGGREPKPKREGRREPSRRGGRERGAREGARERKPREGRKPREEGQQRRERKPREDRKPREEPTARKPAPSPEPAAAQPAPATDRPKRKRRRRWGRRRKGGVRVHDLLLPAAPGGRAIVYGADRVGCTALLRELAAELVEAKGPDPIALLIDPSPEELAEWKRVAPAAEIVAAGKATHAEDALAQAVRRAQGGEGVVVLIDSLTRFAEDFAGAEEARELFDAGLDTTVIVVAALERLT